MAVSKRLSVGEIWRLGEISGGDIPILVLFCLTPKCKFCLSHSCFSRVRRRRIMIFFFFYGLLYIILSC